jgi:hypothetical protein
MFRASEVAVPRRTLFIVGYLIAVAALFSGTEAMSVHASAGAAAVPRAHAHAHAAATAAPKRFAAKR